MGLLGPSIFNLLHQSVCVVQGHIDVTGRSLIAVEDLAVLAFNVLRSDQLFDGFFRHVRMGLE